MKYVTINGKKETMSDDVYSRCELKSDKVEVKEVSVRDPYYKKARRFPNGHLVYLSPYA